MPGALGPWQAEVFTPQPIQPAGREVDKTSPGDPSQPRLQQLCLLRLWVASRRSVMLRFGLAAALGHEVRRSKDFPAPPDSPTMTSAFL
jgi:hypothetical protein